MYHSYSSKKRKGNYYQGSSQSSVLTYDSSVKDSGDESHIKNFRYTMHCPKILSEKPTKLTRLFNENLKYNYYYETVGSTAAACPIGHAAGVSQYQILGYKGNTVYGASANLQIFHDHFMFSTPNLPSAIFDTSLRSCFVKSVTTTTTHYFNAANTSACFELSEVISRQTTDLNLATEVNNVNSQYADADQGFDQGTYAAATHVAVYPRVVGGSPQYYISHNPAWKRHFKTLSTKKFIIGPGQSFKITQHFPMNMNIASHDLSDGFQCYKGWSFLVLRSIGQMTLGGVVGGDATPVFAEVKFSSYTKHCLVGTIINHAINNNSVSQYGEKSPLVTSGVGHHFDEDEIVDDAQLNDPII